MTNDCVPPDPTKADAHWLRHESGTLVSIEWVPTHIAARLGFWREFGGSEITYNLGYRYFRPVLTPKQEDALRQEVAEQRALIAHLRAERANALADVEELRAEITRLTTALDERASEAADGEWRVL